TPSEYYSTVCSCIAAEQEDIVVALAEARRDNGEKWTTDYNGTASIRDQTNVICVTDTIYNDTVSVSKNSPIMNDELKKALQEAFIAISDTEEGKQVIAIYSHEGYQIAKDSDYDSERKAQEFIRSLN